MKSWELRGLQYTHLMLYQRTTDATACLGPYMHRFITTKLASYTIYTLQCLLLVLPLQLYIISKAYRQLGLIRRTFSIYVSVKAKKLLYLSLVRSQLTYCSQLWTPQFIIKDIVALEKVRRRVTKYILNDYSSNYKARLETIGLLPLMHYYEYHDIYASWYLAWRNLTLTFQS